jgi:hypothetical protein
MKPLGRKAYGSIPHLPNSRLGPRDHHIHHGQARICTEKLRDKHDRVIVQQKLDGSCTAIALVDGKILALTKAGYLADSSPFEQHHLFRDWVEENKHRFLGILQKGEWIVGEWLAQAHGTIYKLEHDWEEPWAPFDIMREGKRVSFDEFSARVDHPMPPYALHIGGPISTLSAIMLHERLRWRHGEPEGIIYRVERNGKLDFMAKWVRPDKADGIFLPEISGKPPVWNWRPESRSR